MHYYQHHIGDYRKDTSHLSLLEHGIYRQLLDLYYITEKPLDAKALRLICARTDEEQATALQILEEFFTKDGDKYYHSRCDAEIISYHGKKTKAKASAEIRWNKNKDLQDANALPTDSERNANHKPLTINHKPLTNNHNKNTKSERADALDNGFDEFWNYYPKKVGKDKALVAWNKKKPNVDECIKALTWQKETDQWQKNIIPNPATYINEGRWQDEPIITGVPF
jgi:uncharacterized protein YdaU (DUF1376 family)